MKNLKIIPLAIATAATVITSSAVANTGTTAVETAKRAITMGHGGECSLEMKPVEKGGYYPCIDISPYRIVFVYGGVRVFVTQDGREPFPIMEGRQDSPVFIAKGPWETDLSARAALWWRDNVEGSARKTEEIQRNSENKKAAEEYVNKLMGKDASKPSSEGQPPPPKPEASTESLEVTEDIRRILAH